MIALLPTDSSSSSKSSKKNDYNCDSATNKHTQLCREGVDQQSKGISRGLSRWYATTLSYADRTLPH